MDTRSIGILAGVVSALSLFVQSVPRLLLDQWIDSGMQQKPPLMFGTAGMTVTVYNLLFNILGLLITIVLALGLGYVVGRRLNVLAEYRRFVGSVAVGSTLVVVLSGALILSSGSLASFDAGYVAVIFLEIVRRVVSVSLVVTVGAVAGIALAHFQSSEPPIQPTAIDVDAPARATLDGEDEPGEN